MDTDPTEPATPEATAGAPVRLPQLLAAEEILLVPMVMAARRGMAWDA